MDGFEKKFIVDTNTITQIDKRNRTSSFFQNNVLIPSEVLFESQDHPDYDTLKNLEYPISNTLLNKLIEVMNSIEKNTTLVSLYSNKGKADPLLIACALDARDRNSDKLWAPDIIIVSEDREVINIAKKFNLNTMNNGEFANLIQKNNM